jgi:ankyrin repeat protein
MVSQFGFSEAERESCITVLLHSGADVNSVDSRGRTPLHIAAMEGHRLLLETLLRFGADVALVDGMGMLSLHSAARRGHAPCVRALVAAGADVFAFSAVRMTPLMYAVQSRCDAAIAAVLEASAGAEGPLRGDAALLMMAAAGGWVDTASALVLASPAVDPDVRLGGRTALCVAAHSGFVEVVRVLLSAGADPHRRAGVTHFEHPADDAELASPLVWACRAGRAEAAEALLEGGADVSLAEEPPVLHVAAASLDTDLLGVLVAAGADAGCRDLRGRTALEVLLDQALAADAREAGLERWLEDYERTMAWLLERGCPAGSLIESCIRARCGTLALLLARNGAVIPDGDQLAELGCPPPLATALKKHRDQGHRPPRLVHLCIRAIRVLDVPRCDLLPPGLQEYIAHPHPFLMTNVDGLKGDPRAFSREGWRCTDCGTPNLSSFRSCRFCLLPSEST